MKYIASVSDENLWLYTYTNVGKNLGRKKKQFIIYITSKDLIFGLKPEIELIFTVVHDYFKFSKGLKGQLTSNFNIKCKIMIDTFKIWELKINKLILNTHIK